MASLHSDLDWVNLADFDVSEPFEPMCNVTFPEHT